MVVKRLIAAFILCASCAPTPPPARTGPTIAVEEDTWQFGTIERGQTVTTEIRIMNRGSDTLSVSLYSTCDCLKATIDSKTIAPHKEAPVVLSYTGDEVKERVTKTVFIDSNDKLTPRTAITVSGVVTQGDVPHIVVIPNPLLFEESEGPDTAILKVINRGRQDLVVEEVRCLGCTTDWNRRQLAREEEAALQVELLPHWEGKQWIEIESNDPIFPLKKVSIVEFK
jgi:hypothetical protein